MLSWIAKAGGDRSKEKGSEEVGSGALAGQYKHTDEITPVAQLLLPTVALKL